MDAHACILPCATEQYYYQLVAMKIICVGPVVAKIIRFQVLKGMGLVPQTTTVCLSVARISLGSYHESESIIVCW